MSRKNKHDQICAMHYLSFENAEIENYPGSSTIKVSGDWINLHVSTVEFSEEQERIGMSFTQELKATVTDTSQSNFENIASTTLNYGIIRLDYTSGESRILGTDNMPILLSYREDGSPAVITLSYKGDSPERSKFLQSF